MEWYTWLSSTQPIQAQKSLCQLNQALEVVGESAQNLTLKGHATIAIFQCLYSTVFQQRDSCCEAALSTSMQEAGSNNSLFESAPPFFFCTTGRKRREEESEALTVYPPQGQSPSL